jgi:hypothetical protein
MRWFAHDFGSMPDVTVIYAYFVATSTATFEIVALDDSLGARYSSLPRAGLPDLMEAACTIPPLTF